MNWFVEHPLETIVLVANAVVNGFRMAYPVEAERPRAVRFVLGVLDPFALNFWGPFKR